MKDSDQKYFSVRDSDLKYFNNLQPCCRRHQLLSQQRPERRRETTLGRFLKLLTLCTQKNYKRVHLGNILQLLTLSTKESESDNRAKVRRRVATQERISQI